MDLLNSFKQLQQKRFSPRDFSDRVITEDTLFEIMDGARHAPSCFNEQPWRFVYAYKEDKENFQRLLSCLVEKNQEWAQHASVLMLSVAKNSFSANDKPNRHAWYDTGAAVNMMTLKATAMDIYVHQMAGFDAAKAKESLQIPENFDAVAMIALGYLDDAQRNDKPRRSLDEIASEGLWRHKARK